MRSEHAEVIRRLQDNVDAWICDMIDDTDDYDSMYHSMDHVQ